MRCYTIHESQDGEAIGEVTMTDEQFCRYMNNANGEPRILDHLPKIDDLSIVMDGTTEIYLT